MDKGTTKNGETIWVAYCETCQKELKSNTKGNIVEAVAKLHVKKTGHSVIVGNRWS